MPTRCQPREVGRREDAALADDDAVARDRGASRSLVASVVSKVLRLRLLMPISRDFEPQRALELGLVVHFDQHVHAELDGGVFERLRASRRRPPP